MNTSKKFSTSETFDKPARLDLTVRNGLKGEFYRAATCGLSKKEALELGARLIRFATE